MKIASGETIEVAWNKERLEVLIAINPDFPVTWMRLAPSEARTLAHYLNDMAQACESRTPQ